MSIIDEAKKVFLESDDVDSEMYEDNLKQIQAWEQSLVEGEALAEWQEHDVTKKILSKAKHEYLEASLQLANNRNLDEQQRFSLFAKKDACSLMIELTGGNVKEEMKQLNREIKQKIVAVSG